MPAAPNLSIRGLAETPTAPLAPRRSPPVPQSVCLKVISFRHLGLASFPWGILPRIPCTAWWPTPLPLLQSPLCLSLSCCYCLVAMSSFPLRLPAATFVGLAGHPLSGSILPLLKCRSVLSPPRSQNNPSTVSQNGYRT